LHKEAEGRWHEIHWQPDLHEALALAQSQNKPIMVFAHVNHMAQAHGLC
jgi:hypothetical protein